MNLFSDRLISKVRSALHPDFSAKWEVLESSTRMTKTGSESSLKKQTKRKTEKERLRINTCKGQFPFAGAALYFTAFDDSAVVLYLVCSSD